MTIALVHDYVTQRGGAERVALSLARAFPGSPLHTTLYRPETTFPEFAELDIRPSRLNRWSVLRNNHRLALPFLAQTVSRMHIDADIVVASSSGWAHGIHTDGRKIVYCHAPARWLYQVDRYAGTDEERSLRRLLVRAASGALGPGLRRWDREAADSADLYIVNSTAVRDAVRRIYDIDAEVVYPPVPLMPSNGPEQPVEDIQHPFLLCVARLLPYKNVDAVIDAIDRLGSIDLVVVGEGPDRERLRARASRSGRTRFASAVSDAELRWLYRNCSGLVAASFEDFGLSPLEAAAFGKPTAALRAGGYLDTVRSDETGVFFAEPTSTDIAEALETMLTHPWQPATIAAHIEAFSEPRFIDRLRAVVRNEQDLARAASEDHREAP
ncbi:MAG TPA: glycosyltransferase [Lacisediminihabitans sp.]|uniref:glycosyltransferase n=1 Tax=Lacisediminihabitans sp. TaxID=2787631 RepID=UPI002ED83ED2